jgi:hypothetical protein
MYENIPGEITRVKILNISGKIIWSGNLVSNASIPAGTIFCPGIYFVSFTTDSSQDVRKVVVN